MTLGSSSGNAWCSTYTDGSDNHINGYEKDCGDGCRVNDCPVGFYRNYMDNTCYQVGIDFRKAFIRLSF